ncbi:MAG: helix-turn-helix transcriptional regulator [Methanosarcinales archaeon]|nr:helix-turn-helix transcriptional regulator [Methanosarcinales archaeon]
MKTLAKLCEENNMTLITLAEKTGLHLRTLSKISANPNTNITIRVIQAIYNAEGFSPHQYLNNIKFGREVGSAEDNK